MTALPQIHTRCVAPNGRVLELLRKNTRLTASEWAELHALERKHEEGK